MAAILVQDLTVEKEKTHSTISLGGVCMNDACSSVTCIKTEQAKEKKYHIVFCGRSDQKQSEIRLG